jgi:hypothetical protein
VKQGVAEWYVRDLIERSRADATRRPSATARTRTTQRLEELSGLAVSYDKPPRTRSDRPMGSRGIRP